MQPFFTFVFTLLLVPSTFGQLTYIPDDDFEQTLIYAGLDTVLDDSVQTNLIDTLTFLNLPPIGVMDLTGIEDFVGLKYLICPYNYIQLMDLSNNVSLEFINCVGNNITIMDVTNCPNLRHLDAKGNNLSDIDLTQNPLLELLVLDDNGLGSINLQANTVLKTLALENTSLSSLDLSNNVLLETVNVSNNQLGSIDLTNLVNLKSLSAINNYLTQLDVSTNTALETIYLANNDLASLDFQNNLVLDYILCTYNVLTYMNLPPTNPLYSVGLGALNNPNLFCIQSDDPAYVLANWNLNIEPFTSISTLCYSGINEFEANVNIYPNPSENGWVSIQLEHAGSYALYDLHGKRLQAGEINNSEAQLDFSAFGKGMYLFQVNVDGEVWMERIELL